MSTFYRWVKMYNCNRDVKFALVPVDMEPIFTPVIFRYMSHSSSSVLCNPSTELLLPGDYSMIPIAGDKFYFAGEEVGVGCYRDMQIRFPGLYQQEADRCFLVDKQVRNRDRHCLLTGTPAAECALTSVWIMPPSAEDKKETIQRVWRQDIAYSDPRCGSKIWDNVVQKITGKNIDISLVHKARVNSTLPVRDDMAEYISDPDPRDWSQTARNYITFREDLADMLMDNKITIDPDDTYRIVIPHLSDEIRKIPLLTHMKLDHIMDPTLRPRDRFFRCHLFMTLASNSFGGDISLDYPGDYTEIYGGHRGLRWYGRSKRSRMADSAWEGDLGDDDEDEA